MGKVNWQAKFEYDFMANLRIFQQALQKIGVTKKIDLNKLVKAKYQDNLEMIQWLKRYLEMTAQLIPDYNALVRRSN